MFRTFSGGYYLGRLYVESCKDEHPKMRREQHEFVCEQLYRDEVDTDQNDILVMKLDGPHFPVEAEENLPRDTLIVPDELGDTDVENRRRVLLAKADRAEEMLEWYGWGDVDGEKRVQGPHPSALDGIEGPRTPFN